MLCKSAVFFLARLAHGEGRGETAIVVVAAAPDLCLFD